MQDLLKKGLKKEKVSGDLVEGTTASPADSKQQAVNTLIILDSDQTLTQSHVNNINTSDFSVQAFQATEDEPAFEITKSICQSYTEDADYTALSPQGSFPADTEDSSYTALSPQGFPLIYPSFFSEAVVRRDQATASGGFGSTEVDNGAAMPQDQAIASGGLDSSNVDNEAKDWRSSLKVNVPKSSLGPIAGGGSPLIGVSASGEGVAKRGLNIPPFVEGDGIQVVEDHGGAFSPR